MVCSKSEDQIEVVAQVPEAEVEVEGESGCYLTSVCPATADLYAVLSTSLSPADYLV